MNHLGALIKATIVAQQEDDLPDFLAERIFAIAEILEGTEWLRDEIGDLREQIVLYDTFGQTGYIGMGVDSSILEGKIRCIENIIDKLDKESL